MGTWVDFKAVKDTITMEMVLGHYRVDWLKKTPGVELRGRCPVDGGTSNSFHVNTSKNNFQCFNPKCGAKGNVLDFVAAMEKCSVRDAALKLQDWFAITGNDKGEQSSKVVSAGETGSKLAAEKTGDRGVSNQPLKFTLKGIEYEHAYLTGRGIDKETAEKFGVGVFDGKGSMSGRVVYSDSQPSRRTGGVCWQKYRRQ